MKNIAILGSTGSIGQNALEVVRRFLGKFRVVGLSAYSNINLLSSQVQEFRPRLVCVKDPRAAECLKSKHGRGNPRVLIGEEGLERIVEDEAVDEVVLAISGSAALRPLLKAIECGKEIALANKEALVMAGPLIMKKAAQRKARIIPIDSEQSAIWQCLEGKEKTKVRHIYLTASGGPFRETARRDLKGVSVQEVLKHPRWRMGKKISVDSATLMNKGFELLEAMYLFNVEPQVIKILIHPEAVIHSMVEFVDGVILAQLSVTDMRIPIQYALSYPNRLTNAMPGIDFFKLKSLCFQKPDFKKFPCLEFAYRAAYAGGTAPAVLNAADEVCVNEFLNQKIDFLSIPRIVGKVLQRHRNGTSADIRGILQADAWAREETIRIINR